MIRSIRVAPATLALATLAPAVLATMPAAAGAQLLGGDAAACAGAGPAIQATIVGLKDRTGGVALELYPANAADFLKGDRALIAEGKTFRRVRAATPAAGPVVLCIRVPRPGRYALLFAHDRDGRPKFSFWRDGAGFPGAVRIGRARPKLAQAAIDVGAGVTAVTIRAQYLRGLGGFGPLGD